MIGQGLSASKNPTVKKTIVRDGLVLRHDYKDRPVELCSSGAASFNGTSDYIDCGDIGAAKSLAFWFKPLSNVNASTAYQRLFGFNSSYHGISLGASTGSLSGEVLAVIPDGASRTGTTTTFDSSAWHHVCVSWNASSNYFDIYINGILDTDLSANTHTLANWDSFIMGTDNTTGTHFGGYMCNVGIWSTALTQPQVKSIMHKDYASLSDSEKTSLVSWWNLDSTMVTAKDGGEFGVLDNHYGGGSELGSEMWDGANGDTTHWDNYGTENEISSDDGAVKITYKDDSGGYLILLMDDSHLNANLVVGKFYRLTFSTKINNGSVNWTLNEHGEDSYDADALTSTSFITQQIDFLATASQDHFLFPASMDGTEEVWIKDISLKLINGNTGTLS